MTPYDDSKGSIPVDVRSLGEGKTRCGANYFTLVRLQVDYEELELSGVPRPFINPEIGPNPTLESW